MAYCAPNGEPEKDLISQTPYEPILAENHQRFCMFPIKYHSVWEMYKKAEASFWTGKYRSQIGTVVATD